MRLALEEACISAGDVGCLEMHGTGTPLGDPIEVGAAAAVFRKPSWSVLDSGGEARQALCLGAVKSTLGHTEPAAGATAICRTLFRYVSPETPKPGERILVCNSKLLLPADACPPTGTLACISLCAAGLQSLRHTLTIITH